MLQWTVESNIHICRSNGIEAAVITEKDGKWYADFNWEPLNQKASEVFDNFEFAKDWVESYPHKKLCKECNKMQEVVSICSCGACLYNHSESLNDPMYPLFRCNKCKQVNFWD